MGFVYISVHSFTNVWFGGGYGIFSDPDGDRRHFNRDVYGIWFTVPPGRASRI